VRPRRAREEKPKVSAFLSAKIDRSSSCADCVFGFSICRPTSRRTGAQGRAGHIFNQRSVEEVFAMLYQVGGMVGPADDGCACWKRCASGCWRSRPPGRALPERPRVFFEEWDEPPISGIRWVSQLVGIAGGDDSLPGSWRCRRSARTASCRRR
jgi:iron complex transport system substrate-binding protein